MLSFWKTKGRIDSEGVCADSNSMTVIEVKPIKNKGGRPKGAKRAPTKLSQREIASAVIDYARGVEQREIAKKLGVGDSAVSMLLDKFKPAFQELVNVEEYRKVKGEILDSVQLAALKELSNPGRLEEAPVNQLAYVVDITGKHSRLEQGLSTSNVATQTVSITYAPGNRGEE